ncbi:MAG: translesion error-prone DNA polymerase V autoproteolytic subunit [Bacteroidales bacterium]|jgi:DNA polymerase V|nr:translesion error-prone DNA polymerase V autoproteolytic subunit [Bacteroidales bacterium]
MIVKELYNTNKIKIFVPDTSSEMSLSLLESMIPAGFPSPADDYLELPLDLNEKLIRNPSSTFFAQISGSSMINAGINDGDIVIVDKSLQAKNDSVLVCIIDGEFTLKRFKKIDEENAFLMAENPEFDPIKINKHNTFQIWGVVTYSIHKQY